MCRVSVAFPGARARPAARSFFPRVGRPGALQATAEDDMAGRKRDDPSNEQLARAFELRYGQDLPVSVVARRLGFSPDTIRTWFKCAKYPETTRPLAEKYGLTCE